MWIAILGMDYQLNLISLQTECDGVAHDGTVHGDV